MKIKFLTGIYVFLLIFVVFLADLRGTQYLLDFVGAIPYGDKIGHFVLMGTFALFVNLSLRAKTLSVGRTNFLLGSLLVLVIVTLEEFSQIFVVGRSFDLSDLWADYSGIFVFGEIARYVCRKRVAEN